MSTGGHFDLLDCFLFILGFIRLRNICIIGRSVRLGYPAITLKLAIQPSWLSSHLGYPAILAIQPSWLSSHQWSWLSGLQWICLSRHVLVLVTNMLWVFISILYLFPIYLVSILYLSHLTYLPVYWSIFLGINPSIHSSIHPPIHPFIHPSIHPSIYLSIYLSIKILTCFKYLDLT